MMMLKRDDRNGWVNKWLFFFTQSYRYTASLDGARSVQVFMIWSPWHAKVESIASQINESRFTVDLKALRCSRGIEPPHSVHELCHPSINDPSWINVQLPPPRSPTSISFTTLLSKFKLLIHNLPTHSTKSIQHSTSIKFLITKTYSNMLTAQQTTLPQDLASMSTS